RLLQPAKPEARHHLSSSNAGRGRNRPGCAASSRVKPLTFAAANQFQWWTGPALLPRVDQFALTFPYTIQNKLESQLFTGLSTKVFSLQTSVLNPSSVPLVTTAIDTFSGEEEMLDECLAP